MGAKTKTVGGGSATPVANEFNNFLMQQLRGPSNPSVMDPNFLKQFDRTNAQQTSNAAQPQQQTTGFQNAFNQALSGQVNDQSGAAGALQNYFKNPNQFSNTFTAPTFQGAQTSQLPTNFGAGQTGMANLSGFGNAAQSNFNVSPLTSAFTNSMQRLLNQGSSQLANNNGGFAAARTPADVALASGMSIEDALQRTGNLPFNKILRDRAIADQRARFGAEGAGALGTGAQFAEATLNADLAARDQQEQFVRAQQLMQQDLAERSTGANVGLQNRGQNIQTAIANMQGGLQGAQNQTALLNQLLSAAGQARGQDLSTGLGQQQLGAQQSMFNAGQANDMQTAMLNAALQNQGLGNNFGLNAAQLNNNAMQTNNANAINQSQFQNTFNQNNAQLGAQYGLGANQLNAQQLQNMIGQGLNLNQLGNSNMMGVLGQLFGGFGQSNALGTPQAQVIQQPSAFGQIANAGIGLLGSYLGGGGSLGGLGGLFGGGTPQMPNVNVPTANVPIPSVNLGSQNIFSGSGGFQMPGLPQLYGNTR